MTRGKRIAFELLGPALIGAIPVLLTIVVLSAMKRAGTNPDWKSPGGAVLLAGAVLMFTYLYVGVPSILYAIMMEWRFSEGLNPASWRSVGLSLFLGLCSGALMASVGSRGSISQILAEIALLGGLGLVVGLLMGWLIKRWSSDEENPAKIHGQ